MIIVTCAALYGLRSRRSGAASRDAPQTFGLTEPDPKIFLLQDGSVLSTTRLESCFVSVHITCPRGQRGLQLVQEFPWAS